VYSKILMLRFPQQEVQKPVVCHLAKDFNLVFNILNARILPRKEGVMVMELYGTKEHFKDGVRFLKAQGVRVQNASQEVHRNEEKCTHCGACTAVCPTGALWINRPDMSVTFEQGKCSVCELCVTTCPVRAMDVTPSNQAFLK